MADVLGTNIDCSNTVDGYCTMTGACSTFSAYMDYNFKFDFSGATDGNYMRLPIATFVDENGQGNCQLQMMSLTSNNIVLGSMFMQEFFTTYTNDYSNLVITNQVVNIYEGLNPVYSPYVGNESLAVGTNPFSTPSSDSTTAFGTWTIVGISAGGAILLIAILIASYYCCCRNDKESLSASAIVYQQPEGQSLMSKYENEVP